MNHSLFRTLAISATLAVWVVSLLPLQQTLGSGSDKLHHLLAYAGLMIAWRLAIPSHQPRRQLMMAIALIGMGLAIEFAQGLTPYRYFEWADAFANALGVLVGWTISIVIQKLRPVPRHTPR